MRPASQINDLRSALDFLKQHEGQFQVCDALVDPEAELAGVYRLVGAGTPVEPPTKRGPAMLFTNVKGYDIPVVTGVLACRERVGLLLDSEPQRLPMLLLDALNKPLEPVMHEGGAPCQEVVHQAELDIRKIMPAPSNTELDAGPYFSMGLVRAEDPVTGKSDVTIHRMCVQGPDLLSIYFVPGRHIDQFRIKAEQKGRALPVSINIGLDPAIYLAACFEPPTTPLGFDELTIAGGLRGRPVELAPCVSVKAKALARAEIVIEGEIIPNQRIAEDANSNTGYSMPEFPGYMGPAKPEIPLIRVKAITHRKNPILQTIVGPGLEHTNLAGIPTEASIFRLVEQSMPGKLLNVYAPPSGGGKFLVVMQFKKTAQSDEGRQRQAALAAFTAFSELKHAILVDEDVDIYNMDDVMWAMTTRFQGDISTVFIPGVRCHPLDPSQTTDFNPAARGNSIACKTIFDCTVPYNLKDQFKRAPFKKVDLAEFLPREKRT